LKHKLDPSRKDLKASFFTLKLSFTMGKKLLHYNNQYVALFAFFMFLYPLLYVFPISFFNIKHKVIESNRCEVI